MTVRVCGVDIGQSLHLKNHSANVNLTSLISPTKLVIPIVSVLGKTSSLTLSGTVYSHLVGGPDFCRSEAEVLIPKLRESWTMVAGMG